MAALAGRWSSPPKFVLLLVIFSGNSVVLGWDAIDLELFDLVEEVKDNFYDILGLTRVRYCPFIGHRCPRSGSLLPADVDVFWFHTLTELSELVLFKESSRSKYFLQKWNRVFGSVLVYRYIRPDTKDQTIRGT